MVKHRYNFLDPATGEYQLGILSGWLDRTEAEKEWDDLAEYRARWGLPVPGPIEEV